jgi:predicted amino acid-binding ACT domain protein
MNLFTLGKTIAKNIVFMQGMTRQLGEPVHLSDAACNTVFEDLKTNTLMAQKFALVCNIKTMNIGFHYNTEKFLSYRGTLDLTKFFLMLHPDFMEEYLKWGQATYKYLMKATDIVKTPLTQCTRMTIPLKLKNEKYYWVLQEAICLQVDAAGNLVSHLNIYTILHEMDGNEDVIITGQLYNDGLEVKEWTQTVWKEFFTLQSFILPKEQQRIVEALHKDLELSNKEIAVLFNKQKNTIDVQNKHIIARANACFPMREFGTVKEVVRFLREIGYFQENVSEIEEL